MVLQAPIRRGSLFGIRGVEKRSPAPRSPPRVASAPAARGHDVRGDLLQLLAQLIELRVRLVERGLGLRPRRVAELLRQRAVPDVRVRQDLALRVELGD